MAGFWERLDRWNDDLYRRYYMGTYADPPGRYFHGTTEEAAQAILRDGFTPQLKRGWTLGSGVYLGPYGMARHYGTTVLAVELDCPIHNWDGAECLAVREACGWRANMTTRSQDLFHGRTSLSQLMADEWRDIVHESLAKTPHPGPQLTAAMLEADIRAVRIDIGFEQLIGQFEICVYDLAAIRIVEVLRHDGRLFKGR